MADVVSAVAGGVATLAVEKLLKKIKSLYSISDQVEEMEDTLSTIRAVFLDVEEKQDLNNRQKDWLRKLKDVVNHIEDLHDDFSTEALKANLTSGSKLKKEVRRLFSCLNKLPKVKAIKKKLDMIATDQARFPLDMRQEERHFLYKKRELTHSSVRQHFIGRDSDKKAITDFLFESDPTVTASVVAIVGMGGIGKTALAQSVYHDERVQKHFQLKIWTCVSNACVTNTFDVTYVYKCILESLKAYEPSGQNTTLVDDLKNQIRGRKYLLILDDVWNISRTKWLDIKDILANGSQGSKILVTTREMGSAKATEAFEHPLKCLNQTESWSLFKDVAFR